MVADQRHGGTAASLAAVIPRDNAGPPEHRICSMPPDLLEGAFRGKLLPPLDLAALAARGEVPAYPVSWKVCNRAGPPNTR